MKRKLLHYFSFLLLAVFLIASSNVAVSQNDKTGITVENAISSKETLCPEGTILANEPDGTNGLTSSTDAGYVNHHKVTGLNNATVESITVWGLMAFHNGTSWVQCVDTQMDFELQFYATGDEPGESFYTETKGLNMEETDEVTFGTWTVVKTTFEIADPITDFSEGFFSIASTNNATCWFLNISSASGTGETGFYDADEVWTLRDVPIGFCMTGEEEEPIYDTFPVTFVVNMTGAVAAGDVTFDPAVHDVYVSGTFADWAQPGSDEAFKLEPVVVAKEGGLYDFFESWESYADFTVAGGESAGTNSLGAWTIVNNKAGTANWGSSDYDFENEGTDYGFIIFNPTTTDPAADAHPAQDGEKYGAFTQANVIGDDKWLISPALEVTATSELTFWAKAMTHAYGAERFIVLVSTTDNDPASFTKISAGDYLESSTDWTDYTFDLSEYDGETLYFAINYVSYDAFFFLIDAITVTDVVAPTEYFYTITLDVEEGTHEYKYFLVEDAPSWDMGEWAGGLNRTIVVSEEMIQEDVWGDEPISVPTITDNKFTVYPNPARDIINVVSGSQINNVRVFDLSGRLVFSQSYNANQVVLDINNFKNGLYIMQIATGEGIQNVKFSVVK